MPAGVCWYGSAHLSSTSTHWREALPGLRTPARPGAVAISSPISSNSTGSMARTNPAWRPSPPAPAPAPAGPLPPWPVPASAPRSHYRKTTRYHRPRPAARAIAGADPPVRPRWRFGLRSASGASAASGTSFCNVFVSSERLMWTPSPPRSRRAAGPASGLRVSSSISIGASHRLSHHARPGQPCSCINAAKTNVQTRITPQTMGVSKSGKRRASRFRAGCAMQIRARVARMPLLYCPMDELRT